MQKVTLDNITHTDYSASFNSEIFCEIQPESHCLDVGCSAGNLGGALIEHKNCLVQGIDINQAALMKAKQKGYEQVFALDLISDPSGLNDVPNSAFDYVICADVLEHLVSPEEILSILSFKLKPGGLIVISLPNVAFGLNRLNLLLGNWNYREYGIMDKTHLRFFTINSGIDLVKKAGLKVQKVRPYNQFGVLRYLNPLLSFFPGFFAYQFIIVAFRGPTTHI